MRTLLRALVVGGTLAAGSLSTLGAQSAADDAREIAAYRLTPEVLKKYQVAMMHVIQASANDPRTKEHTRLTAEIEALENKDELSEAEEARLERLRERLEKLDQDEDGGDLGSAETISQMVAQVTQVPVFAAALKKAGLAPREYAVFSLALLQASMYVGMKQAGMVKEMPKGLNPANVRFVETHQTELKTMQETLAKQAKGGGQ